MPRTKPKQLTENQKEALYQKAAVLAARERYTPDVLNDDILINDDAEVQHGMEGAWVAARVWVTDHPEISMAWMKILPRKGGKLQTDKILNEHPLRGYLKGKTLTVTDGYLPKSVVANVSEFKWAVRSARHAWDICRHYEVEPQFKVPKKEVRKS